jgi:hypothetical protein
MLARPYGHFAGLLIGMLLLLDCAFTEVIVGPWSNWRYTGTEMPRRGM